AIETPVSRRALDRLIDLGLTLAHELDERLGEAERVGAEVEIEAAVVTAYRAERLDTIAVAIHGVKDLEGVGACLAAYSGGHGLTELFEEVRHLDGGHGRVEAFVAGLGARALDRLIDGVGGEDAEG